MNNFTAKDFIKKLESYISDSELKRYQTFFKFDDTHPLKNDKFIGVRMGQIFQLAKEYKDMELGEVEKLLDSPIHEMRVGAVSIMDYQARDKKTSEGRRKELFDLYIKKHDRINTWDLVDRSVIYVVGSYLADKKREILYKLAKSKFMPERRSAIVATAYFMMKQKDTEDVFKIAELLLKDKEELIHKATGWMLRVAGDVDRKKLETFLEKYADTMPRVMLRYSIEKLDKDKRDYFLKLK